MDPQQTSISPLAIRYRVTFEKPENHLVSVELHIESPERLPPKLTLFMPVWTPGSYLVREFARHVEQVTAQLPAHVRKIRKNAWELETSESNSVTVRYFVYCNELTVRTNHIDSTHALLNGAAVFLAIEGAEEKPARVEVVTPGEWQIASALPKQGERGVFESPNLDTLVDCPIHAGKADACREDTIDACNVKHAVVTWPKHAIADADAARLLTDVKTIIETESKLFGGALPYRDYLFILNLSPRARGGLEHATSTVLLASPNSFFSRDGYLDILSLFAHELFHAWNVKRIRPQGLFPYRYQEENYTRLLWWFEGATSYYDWRVLRLAKLCSVQEYLDHLAEEIAYLDAAYGKLIHPLEETSFDAWIKLYRPDENSQNSSISYYRKGELVCTLLDIEILARTQEKSNLDSVLRHLWDEYGAQGKPVPEDAMQSIFERVTGTELGELFDAWIRSAQEINYASTLGRVGLAIDRTPKADGPPASIGLRVRNEGGRATVIQVVRGTGAYGAGIDTGDEVIAIGNKRVDPGNFEFALHGMVPQSSADVTIARDGRIFKRQVTLDAPRAERVKLVARDDASESAKQAFTLWLGEPHPKWKAGNHG